MAGQDYDKLLLDNQLCFPLYACSKEVVGSYRPYLDKLDLTYTQYISLLVLWEHGSYSVKELGSRLYLDSGTLTPVLKSLESKGLVKRERSKEDERSVIVTVTPEGYALRDKALSIPEKVGCGIKLEPSEAVELYRLLHKILDGMNCCEE